MQPQTICILYSTMQHSDIHPFRIFKRQSPTKDGFSHSQMKCTIYIFFYVLRHYIHITVFWQDYAKHPINIGLFQFMAITNIWKHCISHVKRGRQWLEPTF